MMQTGDTTLTLSRDRYDAVLFDNDGVVTDTAAGHAAAWKRTFDFYLRMRFGDGFEPFDPDSDYRAYVDGRPRHDGVEAFLAARGVHLPEGTADDPPDADTVYGVGNRKNGVFQGWLEGHPVRAHDGVTALIQALKAAGMGVAVYSSSRNCTRILEVAGLIDRFDAKVDGADLRALHLPGIPDPAMLREAARRLGAAAARTVVVDGSLAGVRAGKAGGFGLVVGVDHGALARGEGLRQAGADLVVSGMNALTVGSVGA